MLGETHLNSFGIRVTTCSVNLDWEINHDGTGHVFYSNGSHDSGGFCTRVACNGVGESADEGEFDILSTEETAPDTATASYRYCLDHASNPNSTGTHCTVPFDIAELASHSYAFSIHAHCAGGILETEGVWEVSGGDQIEITHL
jgi:hypothetical protein